MIRAHGRLACALALLASATFILPAGAADRWYKPSQVKRGEAIYVEHCATCHGTSGEGQPGWQERDEMGYYPPPPLNADGHAWHHPLASMLATLETGGAPTGGSMPSFADVLKKERDRRAVLAYMQSLWPDEIYRQWVEIDAGRATPPAIMQHQH